MRNIMALALSAAALSSASAFVAPSAKSAPVRLGSEVKLNMMDPVEISTAAASASSIILAETEPWVQPLSNVLGPFLNIFSFAMLCRVVISWYPTVNLNELPFNLAVWPTEPLLRAIRGLVPPAFGVDITPIVWLAVFSFFNEILLGQQGLLTMKIKYGI